jgi:hypothetical protein
MALIFKPRPRSDFYFTLTAWELEGLRHFHRVNEDHLSEMLRRYEISEESRNERDGGVPADLAMMIVEARVPRMMRNPVLIAAWTLYESCLFDISHFFKKHIPLPYSLTDDGNAIPEEIKKRWRKWDLVKRTKYFYSTNLGFDAIPNETTEAELQDLRCLRNILVHSGGRRTFEKPALWDRLVLISRRTPGVDVETGFVIVTPEFVRSQIDLVERATKHVVAQARRVVDLKGLAT